VEFEEILRIALTIIIGTIGLAIFGIIFGLAYKGVDRKLSARMQGRIGPPLSQPFRDIRKLFIKENIVPDNAIPWVFHLAPLMGLIATISILLYLPVGGFSPLAAGYGDLILILYLLIIPSLALVIGGFASGSPYATVGAQREMVTMMAYEFPLAIIIITFAWKLGIAEVANPFTISAIMSTPIWGIVGPLGFIGFIILLIALIIVTPAELSKIPFDAPEAETEIGGGLLVEYSGRNLGMFYLMDSVKTVVMATIIVTLFFPYNLSNFIGIEAGTYPAYIIDIIFYLIKVLIVIVVSVSLIRVAVARLKIDQIVYTYWVWITLLALFGLICVLWDSFTGLPRIVELLGLV
jgi:formate hydrogenlyase subunit 4